MRCGSERISIQPRLRDRAGSENRVGLTVNQQVANRLASHAAEMSAMPGLAAQHSILSLADWPLGARKVSIEIAPGEKLPHRPDLEWM